MGDFQLRPTGPDPQLARLGQSLFVELQEEEERRIKTRPLLIAWSFRMEPSLHRELRLIAKKSGVSMSSVIIGALRLVLPIMRQMLGAEVSPPAPDQIAVPQRPRQAQIPLAPPPPAPPPTPNYGWTASSITSFPGAGNHSLRSAEFVE
jgi:hypothetical protein